MGEGTRDVRFGVFLGPAHSGAAWAEKARRAEDLGFATVLAGDHVAEQLSPFVALTAAACATERLRVGTNVLNNDLHHPVLLARQAATLQLVSDGRFELGLGAGHMKHEYDALGLSFDPPGRRVDRLTESVAIVKALLAGHTVEHRGEHYAVEGATGFPTLDAPLPLLVGGNGDRVLRLAAREADIVNFAGFSQREGTRDVDLNRFSWAGLADRIATARAGAPDRFDQVERSVLVQAVIAADDRHAAAEVAAAVPGWRELLPVEAMLDSPFLILGSLEERVEHVRRLRDEHGVTYVTVFEPAMEATAAIIAAL